MIAILRKELRQFFSGLLGIISIGLFLLITGVFVFILPETGILESGYASLDSFFQSVPFIMLFLIPAITMKSFSEEYRSGTYELLRTAPVSIAGIVLGKFFASLLVSIISLLGTLFYVFSLDALSVDGIDTGAMLGSYIGLILLCAVYVSIGLFTSSIQSNSVISFLLSALLCFIFYSLFSSLAEIEGWKTSIGYYVSLVGIQSHYENISKGNIDTRDVVYFISAVSLFIYLTILNIKSK
ncbi:MAG: ABC transporter permease subunit [bacterium]